MGRVRAFDDTCSWLHFAYAAIITAANPIAAVAAAIVFTAYQLHESEKPETKRGDFIEFMAGLLVGAVLSLVL